MNDNRTPVCECGNAKDSRCRSCATCAELEARSEERGSAAPRLETALRHFDWVAVDDLYVSLDLGEYERGKYSAALSRLVRLGRVLRRRVPVQWGRYKGTILEVRLAEQSRSAA